MDTYCCGCHSGLGRTNSQLSTKKLILATLFVGIFCCASTAGQQSCQSSKPPFSVIFIENIPENWPINTVLSHLDIIGSDSEIQLQLPHNDFVRLDNKSRNLTLIKRLNREDMDSISFNIKCTIISRSQSIDISVKIFILDINNNPPIFVKSQYTANMSEMVPTGTTVVSGIEATDKDVDNWYITYELVDGQYSDYFTIPIASKGTIVLKKQLDYELTTQMQVVIMAKDNHNPVLGVTQPQLNSTSMLIVNVYDGDDQNPAFLHSPYLAMVEENSPVGLELDVQPKIFAFDQDFGLNSSVEYSLVPDSLNAEDTYFTLDPIHAKLELKKDALRRGTKFCLLIKATETPNPDRYATTSVRVWVQAANENAPRFIDILYKANLVENTPVGSPVVTVSAIDNDEADTTKFTDLVSDLSPAKNGIPPEEGAILTYGMDSQVQDFTIDPKTGQIKTAQLLDYEKTKTYNVTVTASDGKNTDTAYVQIIVINVNNHNPVFSQNLYEFKGPKNKGAMIGKLEASDGDSDAVLTYRFVESSSLFMINGEAEVWETGDPEDYTKSEYRLFVIAEDNGSPPRQGSAAVSLNYEGTPVVGASTSSQTDLIVIIVLGVLAGCLIIIIVILCIYVYRKAEMTVYPAPSSSQSESPMLQSNPAKYPPSNHIVRSQSFEQGLNLNKKDYKTYMDITDPDGLAYTPTPAQKERHLRMYNDINIDNDSTTTQENPFSTPQRNGYVHTNGADENLNKGYIIRSANSSNSSVPHSSKNSLSPYHSSIERNNGVNEIEFATAITPMDQLNDLQGSESTMCGDSSLPSSTNSVLDMSTFRAGSTQKLVSSGRGSHSSHKGSGNVSSFNTKNKGSNVSFIDNHQVNVYNPQNAIDPNLSVSPKDERPGITLYY